MADKPEKSKSRGLSRTKQSIAAAMEQAEANKRREMMKLRVDLARKGVAAFEHHSAAEAAMAFKTYLRLLEEIKEVKVGGLHPGLFDKERDIHELLLITGVYWDLTKLYDKTKSAERKAEFLHYMEKFIAFANGMSYQNVCAETLRKYLSNKNPYHKEEFKNAYKILGKGKCYVATALMDVTEEETLVRLRNFRDSELAPRRAGRAAIAVYYKVGPTLARFTDLLPERVRSRLGRGLDRLARFLMK
jgi:hypothetical protein